MNSPAPSPREEDLFHRALTLPAADRAAFLDRECTGDPALRAAVNSLLALHGSADSFLRSAAPELAATEFSATVAFTAPLPEEKPGDTVDRYKLLQKIGEGGCGIVYLAEQEQPVRRRVALKVIKLGMDTKAVVTRFEAERQALAMMDHPNIAKVLDAGATATGRPFFVMELVRGVPITKYCDEHNLPTPDRLALFTQVCLAIQHAHQKGIIHRDIKPSNVLVTVNDGVPVPKVIDFGIAKATHGRLTDATLFTAFEQFIGTPAYMSPEQAAMTSLDIDTRSDIYSLGVLLYELLTGKPPFDPSTFLEAGLDEMRRIIREVEPPLPSTRLGTLTANDRSTVAKLRGSAPAQLSTLLRGDLDWIAMRCLEKDRTRRYESAGSLAQDIRRHLDNEPVLARPASPLYRVRKLARRHRLAFAAGTAVAAALLIGGAVATWQAVRARRAEHVSQLRAYASDINLAQQAVTNQNYVHAAEILDRLRPARHQPDLRGWEWRFLWQQCRSDETLVVKRKWGYGIRSVALSADGASVAFGRDIEGVDVSDVGTKKIVGHVWAGNWPETAFSPTQPLLAVGGSKGDGQGHWTGAISLWDAKDRRVVREIALAGACRHVSFSVDGRTLIVVQRAASPGGPAQPDTFTRYEVATGQPVSDAVTLAIGDDIRLRGAQAPGLADPHTPFVAHLAAGLAVHTTPRGFCVIELATGRVRWSHDADATATRTTALALSADGKLVASADSTAQGVIALWDAATGRPIGQLAGNSSPVRQLAFMPDGTTLVSGHTDFLLRVWHVPQLALTGTLNGHTFEVSALAVGADNRTLVSGAAWNSDVLLWDLPRSAHPTVHFALPAPSRYRWRFGPDGRSVLTSAEDDTKMKMLRWSGRDFRERETLAEIPLTSKSAVLDAANSLNAPSPFEVDFTKSAIGFAIEQMERFSLGEWWTAIALSFGWDEEGRRYSEDPGTFMIVRHRADKTPVTAFHFGRLRPRDGTVSLDGRRLAVCADGNEPLKVFDVESGRELLSFAGGLPPLRQVQFSPDGNALGARALDGTLHLWTAPSWAEILAAETAPRPTQPDR